MRVLLTGKNGQLGQAICAAPSADWELLACDRQMLDITDAKSVQTLVREWQPALIINTAAFTQVDGAQTERDATWQANVLGPAHLATAARDHGAQLLHFSTDYVFSGGAGQTFCETDSPAPINYYGYSKWQGEQRVLQILPQAKIIRTAWLFSPYGRNFVRTMLHLALRQPVLRIVDDQRGCPTCATQLVRYLPAFAASSLAGGIYHLAGTPAVSWFELACAIFHCAADMGWPIARLPQLQSIPSTDFVQAAPRPSSSVLTGDLSHAALHALMPDAAVDTLTLDWRTALPQVVSTLLRTDPLLQAICALP